MTKSRDTKRPSQVEVYKGIRKGPIPPGRTIQPKDRNLEDEVGEREVEQWRGWRGEPFEEYEDD